MAEKNYLRKGTIYDFVQSYQNENPIIKVYGKKDGLEFFKSINKNYSVGYGEITIDCQNKVHAWGKGIDQKHLEDYKNSKKKGLLKIVRD
jgi:hypothetical protein